MNLRELTPEQERALQSIMDNLDHLSEDEVNYLLEKYTK